MKRRPIRRSPGRPKSEEQETPIRELILTTSSNLFMEFGYESVSLEQIAQACNVTKASLYYYFSNKANLFTASVTQMLNNIKRYTQRILAKEADLRTRLQDVAIAKMSTTHVDFETMMREVAPILTDEQIDEIRKAEQSIHDVLASSFRQAMESGDIVKADPLLMAHAFSSLIMIGNKDAAKELFSSRQLAAIEIVELFWSGVAPRPK